MPIAGPNGAGKTTFAREFLPNEADCPQFVNADLIAAGVSPFLPASADVTAGRIMLRRLDELTTERIGFAIETTHSGHWLANHIRQWKEEGYTVEIYYLRLPTPEMAITRIAKRVSEGGHHIPDPVCPPAIHAKLESVFRDVPFPGRHMVCIRYGKGSAEFGRFGAITDGLRVVAAVRFTSPA